MYLFDELKLKLDGQRIKLVFPEGNDVRVLGACIELAKESHVSPGGDWRSSKASESC